MCVSVCAVDGREAHCTWHRTALQSDAAPCARCKTERYLRRGRYRLRCCVRELNEEWRGAFFKLSKTGMRANRVSVACDVVCALRSTLHCIRIRARRIRPRGPCPYPLLRVLGLARRVRWCAVPPALASIFLPTPHPPPTCHQPSRISFAQPFCIHPCDPGVRLVLVCRHPHNIRKRSTRSRTS